MIMKQISIIVAVAEDWAIGKDNDLLWHIPNDFKWFKQHTTGNPVIMGKNTWLSLPKRPLPNRRNIIISDNAADCFADCLTVGSIEAAIEAMDSAKENFIIGGASVYRQFLPIAQTLYLTRVHKTYDADVYFPEVYFDQWEAIFSEHHPQSQEEPIPYTFQILKRQRRD